MSDANDWERLAELVVHRRERELMWTQEQVSAAGGPSTSTQRHIESAQKSTYTASTLQRLERGLRWRSGSVRAALTGGVPVPWESDPERQEMREAKTTLADVRQWAETYEHLSDRDRAFILETLAEAERAELR